MTKFPSWGKAESLDQIRARSTFKKLHPWMQERTLQLIEASGGKVDLGQGFRSESDQREMFLSRYVVDAAGPVQWDGKRWRKKDPSFATAAPPGRSMHELGLAVDLAGDHAWVVANSSRFSLKHFAWVNNEPWHVQPFELPNSRAQYERAGSPWKIDSVPDDPSVVVASNLEVLPGMRGPAVGELQAVLIRLGLLKDTVANCDEFYGPATQEVVKAFQRSRGLKDDGCVGPKTWAALLT